MFIKKAEILKIEKSGSFKPIWGCTKYFLLQNIKVSKRSSPPSTFIPTSLVQVHIYPFSVLEFYKWGHSQAQGRGCSFGF